MKKNISSKGKICKETEDVQKVYEKYFTHEKNIDLNRFKTPTVIDYSIRTYVTDTTADTEEQ